MYSRLGTPKKVHQETATPNNITEKDNNNVRLATPQSGTKRYLSSYCILFCRIIDFLGVLVS